MHIPTRKAHATMRHGRIGGLNGPGFRWRTAPHLIGYGDSAEPVYRRLLAAGDWRCTIEVPRAGDEQTRHVMYRPDPFPDAHPDGMAADECTPIIVPAAVLGGPGARGLPRRAYPRPRGFPRMPLGMRFWREATSGVRGCPGKLHRRGADMVKRSETISVTRDASLAVVPKWQQKRGFLFRPLYIQEARGPERRRYRFGTIASK